MRRDVSILTILTTFLKPCHYYSKLIDLRGTGLSQKAKGGRTSGGDGMPIQLQACYCRGRPLGNQLLIGTNTKPPSTIRCRVTTVQQSKRCRAALDKGIIVSLTRLFLRHPPHRKKKKIEITPENAVTISHTIKSMLKHSAPPHHDIALLLFPGSALYSPYVMLAPSPFS